MDEKQRTWMTSASVIDYYDVYLLLFAILDYILHSKTLKAGCLLFAFLHCNFILIVYIFFDIITLCTPCDNIQYVTRCLYQTFISNGGCDIIKVRVQPRT